MGKKNRNKNKNKKTTTNVCLLQSVNFMEFRSFQWKHWILFASIGLHRTQMENIFHAYLRPKHGFSYISHHWKIGHSHGKQWILYVTIKHQWKQFFRLTYNLKTIFFLRSLSIGKSIISMDTFLIQDLVR